MFNTQVSAKGTSLVEVMAAVAILTIVILGAPFLFSYGRGQIQLQKHYRQAGQLAAQRLEQLKADNYSAITEGPTQQSVSLDGLSYTRSVNTVDVGPYKSVTVTVSWQQMNQQHDVSLTTFIAP